MSPGNVFNPGLFCQKEVRLKTFCFEVSQVTHQNNRPLSPESPTGVGNREDKTIWIGFIVRYEATSESVGEYGFIGTYVISPVGASFKQTDEWFVSPTGCIRD